MVQSRQYKLHLQINKAAKLLLRRNIVWYQSQRDIFPAACGVVVDFSFDPQGYGCVFRRGLTSFVYSKYTYVEVNSQAICWPKNRKRSLQFMSLWGRKFPSAKFNCRPCSQSTSFAKQPFQDQVKVGRSLSSEKWSWRALPGRITWHIAPEIRLRRFRVIFSG